MRSLRTKTIYENGLDTGLDQPPSHDPAKHDGEI